MIDFLHDCIFYIQCYLRCWVCTLDRLNSWLDWTFCDPMDPLACLDYWAFWNALQGNDLHLEIEDAKVSFSNLYPHLIKDEEVKV